MFDFVFCFYWSFGGNKSACGSVLRICSWRPRQKGCKKESQLLVLTFCLNLSRVLFKNNQMAIKPPQKPQQRTTHEGQPRFCHPHYSVINKFLLVTSLELKGRQGLSSSVPHSSEYWYLCTCSKQAGMATYQLSILLSLWRNTKLWMCQC